MAIRFTTKPEAETNSNTKKAAVARDVSSADASAEVVPIAKPTRAKAKKPGKAAAAKDDKLL